MFAKKALLGAAAALTVLTLAGCSTPDKVIGRLIEQKHVRAS